MNHLYEEGASYYSDKDAEVVVLPYKMYDYKTGKEVEEDRIELNDELEKGYANMLEGRVKSADKVFADIRRDYGI